MACAGLLGLEDRTLSSGDASTAGRTPDATSEGASAPDDSGRSTAVDAAPDQDAPSAREAGGLVFTKPPVLLLAADAGMAPMHLAQDDTYLYFSEANTGGVYRIAKAGGMPVPYWQGLTFPYPVAVDDASVYWGDDYGTWRCLKTGCVAGGETPVAPSLVPVLSIAIDQNNVYWTDGVDKVLFAPLGGADAGTVLWVRKAVGSPTLIATDGQRVYFTATDGLLHMIGVDGGNLTPSVLGSPNGGSSLGVRVAGQSAYWTVGGDSGAILSTPVSTPSATTLATGQGAPLAVASDDVNVYWVSSDGDASALRGCALGDCQVTTLASPLVGPLDVVVDAIAVYYTDETGGAIWKLPK